jgi:hypothetical protein
MLFVFAPLQAIGFKVFQVLGFVSALGLIGGVFLMSGSPAVAAAGRTRHGYCFISPNAVRFRRGWFLGAGTGERAVRSPAFCSTIGSKRRNRLLDQAGDYASFRSSRRLAATAVRLSV